MLLLSQKRLTEINDITKQTCKLDLPEPGGARATWLRSCQKSVRLRTGFRFVLQPVSVVHFFWGGWAWGVFSHDTNFELWIWPQVRQIESHFPLLTRHDFIQAESPAFQRGTQPSTQSFPNHRLHGQLMESLPIWSFNFIWHRFFKATMNVAVSHR